MGRCLSLWILSPNQLWLVSLAVDTLKIRKIKVQYRLNMAAWGRTGPELRHFIPYLSGTGQSTRVWSGLGGMQVSLDHLCQKTPETSFRKYTISITFFKNFLAKEKLNFMNWSWWLLRGLPSLQSLYGIPLDLSLVGKGPLSGAPSLRIGD